MAQMIKGMERINYTIVDGTREGWQQAKNSKTDTEGGPQRKLALKLLFVAQRHDYLLISIHCMIRIWDVSILKNRCDWGVFNIIMRGGTLENF